MHPSSRNQSAQWHDRARRVIPWGTQTNAKRPDERFAGVMPYFVERAEGCRIQDVDGRWYVDYRSALGPVILGYKNPRVDDAVRAQLEKGVLFSMASPLEVVVAEQMVGLIDGLEQVRFMKTGNEVNTACLRLARAFTGRDHVVTCGYHGHGDWFACGRGKADLWCLRGGNGVPAALDRLVTRVSYGDVRAAEHTFSEIGSDIAGLIMVPYDWGEQVDGAFVHRMRELTAEHGALLIFDQVLTGFRLALGGAQEYFGVRPDLTTYAKALANGYPIAAYGGRADVMGKLEDVILTSTYAGETLSLAAAGATLEVLASEPVVDHLWEMGTRLRQGFEEAAAALGMAARCYGLPPAVQFRFSRDPAEDEAARLEFFRGLFRRGIFASAPFLLNYAHREADIQETVDAMRGALAEVLEERPGLTTGEHAKSP